MIIAVAMTPYPSGLSCRYSHNKDRAGCGMYKNIDGFFIAWTELTDYDTLLIVFFQRVEFREEDGAKIYRMGCSHWQVSKGFRCGVVACNGNI